MKRPKASLMLGFIILTGILVGSGSAQEKVPPGKADYVRVLPPTARSMIGGLSKSVDIKLLSSLIKDTSSMAYGFTTGISKEKGSFRLGVLASDLEATIRAGDREKVSKAVGALRDGLSKLGAPLPLITATINIGASVHSGTDLEAIHKSALPVLRPFIEDFISKEGMMDFYRLGEWVQASRLAALAGLQGKTEMAVSFIKEVNLADYFMMEIKGKGIPRGISEALKTISEIGKRQEIGEREIQATLKALETIIEILG